MGRVVGPMTGDTTRQVRPLLAINSWSLGRRARGAPATRSSRSDAPSNNLSRRQGHHFAI
eukprot:4359417-Pyramimonas_sp.AAC.1